MYKLDMYGRMGKGVEELVLLDLSDGETAFICISMAVSRERYLYASL